MKRVALLVTVAALASGCEANRPAAAVTVRDTAMVRDPQVAASDPAPDTRATGAASVASDAIRHPLLWSAQKAGNTTYLLGTMHIGVDADRLPAIVWRMLRDARTFAMEANLDDPRALDSLRPTGRSLRRDLGDTYWKKLEDVLGTDRARQLDRMPPMVPATALSLRGLPATTAMDKVLAARAAEHGKPIVYLEEASHQIALLARWMNIKALKMMLDQLAHTERHTRAMLAAYVAGDEHEILAISAAEREHALRHGYSASEYEQEMQELLYDRNASWITAIEALHATGGGFVAVGAMHLVGPRSVLDLLARNGYRITRIAEPHRDTTGAREPASHATP
jgi:uncharacterized protein